jgi:arylsulfatase A-like enzyme
VDLYPTIADYSGLEAPHKLAGQSLRPLLQNPAAKGRNAAFTLVTRGGNKYGQAVRTERWRYIHWSDGNTELYDELTDPQETHDVVRDPKNQAIIQELKALLAKIGPFQSAKPRDLNL